MTNSYGGMAVLGLSALLLAGCGRETAPTRSSEPAAVTSEAAADQNAGNEIGVGEETASGEANAEGENRAATSGVSLKVVNGEQFTRVLQAHRGKPLLVDFWATWCAPCVASFPHTVELHKKYGSRGLTVISMSLDDPESQPQVEEFLARQGATFENYLSQDGAGTESMKAFEIDAGIPVLRLYDAEGQVVAAFGSGLDEAEPTVVEAAIKRLLPQ